MRRTLTLDNLSTLVAASGGTDARHLGQNLRRGQAAYYTPKDWARAWHARLPSHGYSTTVFDPQCGQAALLTTASTSWTHRFGWDIATPATEGEFADGNLLIGDSNTLWADLALTAPEIRFGIQVANPPFGLRWPDLSPGAEPGATVDSVAHTWAMVQRFAAESGAGYIVLSRADCDRLGLEKHPWVYEIHHYPAAPERKDWFTGVTIPISVAWWQRPPVESPHPATGPATQTSDIPAPSPRICVFHTLPATPSEAPPLPERPFAVSSWYDDTYAERPTRTTEVTAAFRTLREMQKEAAKAPPFNLMLMGGALQFSLTTRERHQRKITVEDARRLASVNGVHPLTLAVEVDTRRILHQLIADGVYTVQPAAQAAVRSALDSVARQTTPIMPVTDFEAVAWADELGRLTVRRDVDPATWQAAGLGRWTPGQGYTVDTGTQLLSTGIKRPRLHATPGGGMQLIEHDCEIVRNDRYTAITDDAGVRHRWLAGDAEELDEGQGNRAPAHNSSLETQNSPNRHEESTLWQVFERPVIPTVAEKFPEAYAENLRLLANIESTIAT